MYNILSFTNNITKKHVKKTISVASPSIFENIMVTIATTIDSIMVGRLGANATAAIGINASVTWFLNSLHMTFSVGALVLVARYVGAKDSVRGNKTATQALGSGMIFALFITILLVFISPHIPVMMGASPDILDNAISYMRIYSMCIFFQYIGLISSGIMRGSGDTKTPMIISFSANILNTF